MAEGARSYGEACGLAGALDLVGERWALLVVRELLLGPRRFTDLRKGLPALSANVLTQRLGGLESAGLIVHRRLPPPGAVQVYELTSAGRALEPAVLALAAWGWRGAEMEADRSVSAATLAIAMRVLFDPDRAKGMKAMVAFHLGPERLLARVRKARFEIETGEGRADAVLSGSAGAILAAMGVFGPADTEGTALAIEGDAALASRFLSLFPRPEPFDSEPLQPGKS